MLTPEVEAEPFVNSDNGISDIKAALDGARFILIERFSEDADLLSKLRQYLNDNAFIRSRVVKAKASEAQKFKDYFEHGEKLQSTPFPPEL